MCSTILGQRLDDDSRMFFWVLGFASIIVIFGSANGEYEQLERSRLVRHS